MSHCDARRDCFICDFSIETNDNNTLPRLTFDAKLAAHRSNRLDENFGQINVPYDTESKSEKETQENYLLPFSYPTYSSESNILTFICSSRIVVVDRVDAYQRACQFLDITSDWQIRTLLTTDHMVLTDRSFSFNDIRALATAIDANLESLVLHAVGLTTRSIQILCQGLNKCVHLNLLVNHLMTKVFSF